MYLIIPGILIGLSLVGIGVIVFRKMPYLKKLAPEAHELGPSVWHDLFPEVLGGVQQIRAREYGLVWLRELEKFLRKIRLGFSYVDRLSDTLIRRVRTAHRTGALEDNGGELEAAEHALRNTSQPNGTDKLKSEEQQFIVEIAKNPKDPELYEKLGNVYLAMKNYPDARESFQAALALRPADPRLERKLARVLKKLPRA